MTSHGDPAKSDGSSDDECLAILKRKSGTVSPNCDKRTKNSNDVSSFDGKPTLHVEVQVEELDSKEEPLKNLKRHKRKAKTPKKYVEADIDDSYVPDKHSGKFKCTQCDAVFKRAAELKRHAFLHELQTRHRCPRCSRCFQRAHGLRTHLRAHDAAALRCPHARCGAVFALKLHLNRHLRQHEPAERRTRAQPGERARAQPATPPEPHQRKVSTDQHTLKKDAIIKTESEVSPDSGAIYETRKREQLDYNTQCAIVNKMHKGRSVEDICAIYKITKDTLYDIWEDRDDYAIVKNSGRSTTKYLNKLIDSKILEWIADCKARNIQVTGKMVQDTAEEFASQSGFVAFNGCKKWLDRFKQKYNIVFRSVSCRKEHSTNPVDSKWRKQFLSEQWLDARYGVADDDIYTADEIGFYYNPSKGRVKKMSGRKFLHGAVKDRLSIFVCTNATGNDKKKLLVCGSEDPLIRSCRSVDTLPVIYIRHAQAHFTTQMFEQFVKYWNRELMLRNKKAILILDRATIHTKLQMSHLKLVFVPWKASNVLMPMKNGIFQRFKEEFRRLLLQEKAVNAIRGIDKNLTCLETLQMLEKAWHRTPRELIFECFRKTGYDVSQAPKECQKTRTNSEDETICDFLASYDVNAFYHSLQEFDSYMCVEDNLLTAQGTNGSIFGGNHKAETSADYRNSEIEDILPIGSDRPEPDGIQSMVCKKRTLDDVEIVRKYLQSVTTSFDTYKDFMEVEKFLLTQFKMM